MKKMVFTLALLLMSLSAAMAQTWDFAGRDPFIGDADEELINADATNWYNDATKGRYNFLAALDNAALAANGTELATLPRACFLSVVLLLHQVMARLLLINVVKSA